MSAPSSSVLPAPVRTLVVLALALLLAAGCAAPGAQRLQGPPGDLPPSLSYVTADVLGFVLMDAVGANGAASIPFVSTDSLRTSIEADTGLDDVDDWIGGHGGHAVRQLDVPGTGPDTDLTFADVRDRPTLDRAMEDWSSPDHDLPSVNGDQPELRTNDEADYGAAAVFDDAVLFAKSVEALDGFLDAADEYAVPERKAMAEYAADVVQKVPAGAVFRFDLLRTHVRRPFQDDPAMLEFLRWATEADALIAARDGWVGVTPAKDAPSVRIIGAFEWVPDLAVEVEFEPVDASLLNELDGGLFAVVAFDDPGQYVSEIVRGITRRNGQYVTGQDVADGEERVELEPLLEELDGNAVFGYAPERVVGRVKDAAVVADQVEAALCLAGASAYVSAQEQDLLVEAVPGAKPPCRPPGDIVQLDRTVVGPVPDRAADAARAGKPPRPPIAWVWIESLPVCEAGPAAGWLSFDGEGEMTFALHVEVDDDAGC